MTANSKPKTLDRGRRSFVILGGGASGISVAMNLARLTRVSTKIDIIEPRTELGVGTAYSTPYMSHLLNVPAREMSVHPQDQHHFVNWLRQKYSTSAAEDSFIPRAVYGRYLRATLSESLDANPLAELKHYRTRGSRIELEGPIARVILETSEQLLSDRIVLALGHELPRNPIPGDNEVKAFPGWSSTTYKRLDSNAPIALIGSGLTAVDAVMALDEEGHRGAIYVVSRHGRWPHAHGVARSTVTFPEIGNNATVRWLVRMLRSLAREQELQGNDWRAVVDSVRPYAADIWNRLPMSERRRFLRHVRAVWEIHRHRMPPQIATKLKIILDSGRLRIYRGQVHEAVLMDETTVRLKIKLRSGEQILLDVVRVINCTGPECDPSKSANALMRSLILEGLACPDPLGLGLITNEQGALISVRGVSSQQLYTLGPLRRGMLWESTAMPEIRTQATTLARMLLETYDETNAV